MSSVPWMKRGSFLLSPFPKVAWRWVTVETRLELYVICAVPALEGFEEPARPWSAVSAGFPRAKARRSRVRKMYSLRQEARAVSRAKSRRSA